VAINATIIADSVSDIGVRNTTFQVEAPRFLLAEINTHRVLAKSAASSRAIPVKKRIEMVKTDPFIPDVFGKNKPGMQATEQLDEYSAGLALDVWHMGIDYAVEIAEKLEMLGTHKQLANRVLEPFVFYTGVMSGTEWDNFWHLRIHPDAQPEFDELAKTMKRVLDASVPKRSQYHLPYTDDCHPNMPLSDRFMVSAARCARVSYKSLKTGVSSAPDEDIALCDDLIKRGHLSPFDHPATADEVYFDREDNVRWCSPRLHKHLYGWMPYRVQVESQLGRKCRRDSHDIVWADDLYEGPVLERALP
jgi:Predicted alternative thymidylate synthase